MGNNADPKVNAKATVSISGFESQFTCLAKVTKSIGAIIATVSLIRKAADKPKPKSIQSNIERPFLARLSSNLAPFCNAPLISSAVTITNIPNKKINTSACCPKTVIARLKPSGCIRTKIIAAIRKAVQAGISNFPILLKMIAMITKNNNIQGSMELNVIT